MLYRMHMVIKYEFRYLVKNIISIISLITLILIPILLDSPIKDKQLWIDTSTAYSYNHGFVTIALMVTPLVIVSLYYKDKVTRMTHIVFTQPIGVKIFSLGKLLGGYMYMLTLAVIGNIIACCIPLYFGEMPYSIITFAKVFIIYTLPSITVIVTVAFFIHILMNMRVYSMFISLFLFIGVCERLPLLFAIRINGEKLGTLALGEELSQELLVYLISNRSMLMISSVVFVGLSLLLANKKRFMEGI